eukprot:4606386-Amphidinium_carterae.1
MGRETSRSVLGGTIASQTTRPSWQLAAETKGDFASTFVFTQPGPEDKPRKDMAGWAWHCTSCECNRLEATTGLENRPNPPEVAFNLPIMAIWEKRPFDGTDAAEADQ